MKKLSIIIMMSLLLSCGLFGSKPEPVVIPEIIPWIKLEIPAVIVPDILVVVEGKTDSEVPMGTFGE